MDKETATRFFFFLLPCPHLSPRITQSSRIKQLAVSSSLSQDLRPRLWVRAWAWGSVLYCTPYDPAAGTLGPPLIPKILWATRASSRACEIPEAPGKRGAKHNVMVKIRSIGPVALGKEGHGCVDTWNGNELWARCSILGALSGGLQKEFKDCKSALAEEQQRGRVESREERVVPGEEPRGTQAQKSRHRLDAERTGVLAESGHISSINTKMAIPGHGCFGKTN